MARAMAMVKVEIEVCDMRCTKAFGNARRSEFRIGNGDNQVTACTDHVGAAVDLIGGQAVVVRI